LECPSALFIVGAWIGGALCALAVVLYFTVNNMALSYGGAVAKRRSQNVKVLLNYMQIASAVQMLRSASGDSTSTAFAFQAALSSLSLAFTSWECVLSATMYPIAFQTFIVYMSLPLFIILLCMVAGAAIGGAVWAVYRRRHRAAAAAAVQGDAADGGSDSGKGGGTGGMTPNPLTGRRTVTGGVVVDMTAANASTQQAVSAFQERMVVNQLLLRAPLGARISAGIVGVKRSTNEREVQADVVRAAQFRFRDWLIAAYFAISFLAYPTLIRNVVDLLFCFSLPSDTTGQTSFLRADFTVRCSSNAAVGAGGVRSLVQPHATFVLAATALAFLYIVGIPLTYLVSLLRNRDTLHLGSGTQFVHPDRAEELVGLIQSRVYDAKDWPGLRSRARASTARPQLRELMRRTVSRILAVLQVSRRLRVMALLQHQKRRHLALASSDGALAALVAQVQENALRERMADPEALRSMLEGAAVPADGVVGGRMLVPLAPVAEEGPGDDGAAPSTAASSERGTVTRGGSEGEEGVDVEEVVHTHRTMQARKRRGEDLEVDVSRGKAGAVAMLHSLMSYHHLDLAEERGRTIGTVLNTARPTAPPGEGGDTARAGAGGAAATEPPPPHVAALLHDATFVRHQRVLRQFVALTRYHFARRLALAKVPDAYDDWEEELAAEDAERLHAARVQARSAFAAESLQAGVRRLREEREARALADAAGADSSHGGYSTRRQSAAGSTGRRGSATSGTGGISHEAAVAAAVGPVGDSLVAAFQQRKAQMGKVARLLRARVGVTADRANQATNKSLISRSRIVMRVLFSRSLRTSFAWNLQRESPDAIMARLAVEGDALSRWLTTISSGRGLLPTPARATTGSDALAKAAAETARAGGNKVTTAALAPAARGGDVTSVVVRARSRVGGGSGVGGRRGSSAGGGSGGGGAVGGGDGEATGPQGRITCWTIIWRVLRMVIAFMLCEPSGRAVRRRLREPTPLFVSYNLFLLREMLDRVELGPAPSSIPHRMARTAAQQAEAAREARREAIAAKAAERAAGQRLAAQLKADGLEEPLLSPATPRECHARRGPSRRVMWPHSTHHLSPTPTRLRTTTMAQVTRRPSAACRRLRGAAGCGPPPA